MAGARKGPDKQEFDWEKFDAILQFGPTRQMCADILECSIDTIKRRVKEVKGITFEEYKEKKMANVKLKLQQKAITMGLGGDRVMLIFCLKNKCGWKDNPDLIEEHISEMEF